MYAIDGNGAEKWHFDAKDWIQSSPVIGADGTIYVGAGISDSNLYALHPDGTEKWRFPGAMGFKSSPAIAGDGTLYIGDGKGEFYALRPDGTEKWSIKLGWYIDSSPAIGSDGTIFVGSDKLYALHPDGTQKWMFDTYGSRVSSPLIDSSGIIYVGVNNYNDTNALYAINPDGSEKWIFETGSGRIGASPAQASDGTIYFGTTDHKLYALNKDGSVKWIYETGAAIDSSPLIDQSGVVCFGSYDGKIYGVKPDGTVMWVFNTNKSISSSPSIGPDHTLYVGASDAIYAIGDKPESELSRIEPDSINYQLEVGASHPIKVKAYYANGQVEDVASNVAQYEITDPSIASVDSEGRIVGILSGTTTLNVKYQNIEISRDVTVFTVSKNNEFFWSKNIGLFSSILMDITYGNELYAAVGYDGMIRTSADGVNWVNRISNTNNHLRSVTWDGARFIVVGDKGTILTSSDGVKWVKQTSGTEDDLFSVSSGNGTLVAVGRLGKILTSTEGVSWEKRGTQNITLYNVIWTGNRFVAVGRFGTLLVSDDGASWVAKFTGISDALNSVLWNGDQFVAVGENAAILTSNDGDVWVKRNDHLSGDFYRIIWNGEQFVAVGNEYNSGIVYYSTDGIHWLQSNPFYSKSDGVTSLPMETLNGGIWQDGRYITVGGMSRKTNSFPGGELEIGVLNFKPMMLYSRDGRDWTDYDPKSSLPSEILVDRINKMIWHENQYVGVGNDGIIINSQDGENWSRNQVGIDKNAWQKVHPGLVDLEWVEGSFVALGLYEGNSFIIKFTDPKNYTVTKLEGKVLRSFLWNGEKYVAVGNQGVIMTSPDGSNWSEIDSGTNMDLNQIIWNGEKFMSVGREILTSSDGSHWSSKNVGTPLTNVAWYRNQYVAIGDSEIRTSADCENWTLTSFENSTFNQIIVGEDQLVIVGDHGDIVSSRDGVTWTKAEQKTNLSLSTISWNGGEYTASGKNGIILNGSRVNPDQNSDHDVDIYDITKAAKEYKQYMNKIIENYGKNRPDLGGN